MTLVARCVLCCCVVVPPLTHKSVSHESVSTFPRRPVQPPLRGNVAFIYSCKSILFNLFLLAEAS